MRYILASKSPRRRELLEGIGLDFEVVVSEVDEDSPLTDPIELVRELALKKGSAVYEKLLSQGEISEEDIIISADTVVACECEILGKPHDREEAKRMLSLLSGKEHRVISGVALIRGGKTFVSHSETFVNFEELTDTDIENYLGTTEPYDKAGAYAIQGFASLFIKGIRGCYFGVVGLPLNVLDRLHREAVGSSLLR